MANKVNTDTMTIEEFDLSDYTSGLEIVIENQLKEIKNLKDKLRSASWEITKKQRQLNDQNNGLEKENQDLHNYCRKLETTNQSQIKEMDEIKERLILECQISDGLEKKIKTLNSICLKQATLQVSLDKENAQLHSRCKELESRQAQTPVFILLLLVTFLIYLA